MKALAPISCACTNLKMASRIVGRAYDEALSDLEINSTQYAILVNVGRYQPISQIKLADHLGLERTSLYRAVGILEKQGLIESESLGEGVTKILKLKSKGTELVSHAKPRWERVQNSFLQAFGRERWQDFLSTLGEVRAHFSEK
jgi:DNA-binding MarR family transcriptional regulator